jgi:hypothetical protein
VPATLKNPVEGVTPHGDYLVFDVASASRKTPWRVDLMAYRQNGACACESFTFDKRGMLDAGAHPAENLECRHIKQAKRWLLFEFLRKLAAERGERTVEGNHP